MSLEDAVKEWCDARDALEHDLEVARLYDEHDPAYLREDREKLKEAESKLRDWGRRLIEEEA